MLDRTIAEEYYECAKELERYYEERKDDIKILDIAGYGDKESLKIQLMEYFFPWKTLEKGQEIDQLLFEFNHSLNKLSKYIGVIDRLGDNLYIIAKQELKNFEKDRNKTKDYSSLLVDYKLEDYKNSNILSDDTKHFAEIYFKFKSLETSLLKWFKTLNEKENYETRLKSSSIYI